MPTDTPLPARLAATIKARRTAAGRSVQDCATAAGVATVSWYQWESGDKTPSLESLERIAEVLGVAPGTLLK